jgi:transcriptional regulator with XRE-family HTH domain
MSNNKDLSPLVRNIRKLGKKKNLSQDELSKLINIAHNAIIKIESGLIKNPKIETVQNIADAFGVSLDELAKWVLQSLRRGQTISKVDKNNITKFNYLIK